MDFLHGKLEPLHIVLKGSPRQVTGHAVVALNMMA